MFLLLVFAVMIRDPFDSMRPAFHSPQPSPRAILRQSPLQSHCANPFTSNPPPHQPSIPFTIDRNGQRTKYPAKGQIDVRRGRHHHLLSHLRHVPRNARHAAKIPVSSYTSLSPHMQQAANAVEASILRKSPCVCQNESANMTGVGGHSFCRRSGKERRRCGRFGRSRGRRREGDRKRGEDKRIGWWQEELIAVQRAPRGERDLFHHGS